MQDNGQPQVSDSLLRSILAPIFQPQAQLGLTQQETATSAQSQATSAQSQATSAQEQANLAATNPGIQADVKIKQIEAQKAQAPFNLANDLTKGMTLQGAMGKYKQYGLSADQIFSQYVTANHYGFPKQSPAELTNMGVSSNLIGQPGQANTYADRYNTGAAIEGIRTAQSLWNKITPQDVLQYKLFGHNQNVQNYLTQRQTVGEHLSSIIPGASGAQATGQANVNILPDPGDVANYAGGIAPGAFTTLENSLLTMKRYTPEMVGVPSKENIPQSNTGKDILNNVLGAVKQSQQLPIGGVSGFNAAASTLAPLGGILGAGKVGVEVLGNETVQTGSKELPGVLGRYINPSRAVAQAGQVRNEALQAAVKANRTINGSSVVSDLQKWAQQAKMGNLGQGDAIDKALQDAESVFANKKINPLDAMKAYNEADSGYTANGIAKSPIQANIDRGLRDVLAKHLDNVAPGWKAATTNMAKSFQADKSAVRAGVKNLAKYGLTLGVPAAAADTITHLLMGR